MRRLCVVLVLGFCGFIKAQGISDFEDLTLQVGTYWNGSDGSGGFASGSAWFKNNYNTQYHSWDGFAYSNISDTATRDFAGQYNAIAGGGQGGSANYAIGYVGWTEPPKMVLDEPGIVSGLFVTNNNYAYYSMLNGDSFAKPFGGTSGNDADWFLLTMTGKNETGAVTGTVDFYLADFRFADNQRDYILNNWRLADLTPLGTVKSVEFSLSSSDTGSFGMNTPAYFAIDTVVPEPATLILLGIGAAIIRKKR